MCDLWRPSSWTAIFSEIIFFFFFCKLLLLLPFVKQRLLPTFSPLHVSFLQSQLASIRLWPTIRFLYLLTTTTFDTTGKLYFTDIGREMVEKK